MDLAGSEVLPGLQDRNPGLGARGCLSSGVQGKGPPGVSASGPDFRRRELIPPLPCPRE